MNLRHICVIYKLCQCLTNQFAHLNGIKCTPNIQCVHVFSCVEELQKCAKYDCEDI